MSGLRTPLSIKGNGKIVPLSATPTTTTIPNDVEGNNPKYVYVLSEGAFPIVGKACQSGDSTALADLGGLLGPSPGLGVVLDVTGCSHLRLAAPAGAVNVRIVALENG